MEVRVKGGVNGIRFFIKIQVVIRVFLRLYDPDFRKSADSLLQCDKAIKNFRVFYQHILAV